MVLMFATSRCMYVSLFIVSHRMKNNLEEYFRPMRKGGNSLALTEVIAQIDLEITKLQQARALLTGAATPASKPGRGRPKGSKNASAKTAAAPPMAVKTKRKLSPEGRKAIQDAMKRRWAERRKQTAK
jgi:hypothetical protein